ncbi:MAG TPA: Rieske (2Fe-2S) protein [Spirochaetota bacterium]|nr:Rieske (2Fe-2S) protein [Spirochaetota bacterium]HPR38704.1 Rieske (2Fe-2S) protein [Spirochaetota bacterium]HRX48738.1 Rieske (2Fe-2S) protein [Spirochaetota bacterium]
MSERTFFQRILGISATGIAAEGSWTLEGKSVRVDPGKLPELSVSGKGVRIEGKELPERILLLHGTDGEFHAYRNRCTHGGRRLDPSGDGVQCCSVGKSFFDLNGSVISGSAKKNIKKYNTRRENSYIIIEL